MGLLSTVIYNIKNIINANKIKAMSDNELLALNDYELFDKLYTVCDAYIVDLNDDDVTYEQKIFYSLCRFEAEVNNGGLCQFFVNSSRESAPYISEALALIGDDELKVAFDNFVGSNNIDVNDLSSFDCRSIDEFETQTHRFDFDGFDELFYEDEDFHIRVSKYARENIISILNRTN